MAGGRRCLNALCQLLSDVEQSRLAVAFTNCHLAKSARRTYPCEGQADVGAEQPGRHLGERRGHCVLAERHAEKHERGFWGHARDGREPPAVVGRDVWQLEAIRGRHSAVDVVSPGRRDWLRDVLARHCNIELLHTLH